MSEQELIRFGVSIGSNLLEKFDELIGEKGYTNRSEAIRDLIRNKIVESEWERSSDTRASIGTVTIVYDHHTREIGDLLTEIAHDHHDLVISSMHAHLTHDSCLEVIIVRGCGKEIRSFSDKIISIRGVKHGKLVITGLVEDGDVMKKENHGDTEARR
ncbi:nickel-responsive transcriptional regulator NikR [Candidatus Latescibacterota bacterium]